MTGVTLAEIKAVGGVGGPGFWPLLAEAVGRIHVALIHFPVALLVVAGLLEVWALVQGRGSGKVSRAAGACLGLGAAAGVLSAGTGWLLAGWPAGREEVEWHRWLGTATAAIALAAWWLRVGVVRREADGASSRAGLYRGVVVCGAALAGVTGHFGGSITHGQGYLIEVWGELLHGGGAGRGRAVVGGGEENGPVGGRARATGNSVIGEDPFSRAWSVFEARCIECHGAAKRKGGLRLDSRVAVLKGGKHGPAVIVGDAAASYLVQRILGEGPDEQMPPEGDPLTDEQVQAIEAWIAGGAQWPEGRGAPGPTAEDTAEEKHWAYVPPVKAVPPAAGTWGRNPIDGFALEKMTAHGLAPSPEAEKGALLRRVTLDLTGLPPTVEELDAFEQDATPDAYEKAVDRLLASPSFGERWARPWLDLARYGDSRGYEKDQTWVMWPYRDWVINALNADTPFDRFSTEQIAGDLLPNATEQQKVATGFERLSMLNEEGGIAPEEARVTAVVDRVDTTATVWLGATMGCARCHDHKFDPVTMKDYYGFFAYFNSTAEEIKTVGDGETHLIAPSINIAGVPGASVQVMQELEKPRETHVMHRGNFRDAGEAVKACIPAAMTGNAPAPTREDRLGLAQWITDKGNPLTARVQVNRLWSVYFGRGLVETEEDFGTRGAAPSHQKLLDWLACEFIESGWSQKHIHRLIVTSAVYRQSSLAAASKAGRASLEKDPQNAWLARAPRPRLEAEAIRDQALSLSGLLSTKFGGPSVKPPQPEGIWGHAYSGEKWIESTGEDRYRRGIYTFVKRATPYPSMAVFDAPSRQVVCPRRTRSNTPLQALTTLNDPVFVEAALGLARRVMLIHGNDPTRIAWAFRACTARGPTPEELAALIRALGAARTKYIGRPDDARLFVGEKDLPDADAAELAGWTVVSNILLNLDEVLCKG